MAETCRRIPATGGLCSIAEEGECENWERDEAVDLAIRGERLCRDGEWSEGIKCLEDALEMGPTDPVTLSALYSQLGNAHFFIKSYDKAVDIYRRGLELARQESDRRAEANVAANMSNTFKVIGKYEDSLKMCHLHLEICRELEDKAGEAQALYTLGAIQHIQGKVSNGQISDKEQSREFLREAVKHFKDNLEVVTALGDVKAQCKACGSIGSTYCLLGDFKQAVHYYRERLKLAKDFGDILVVRRAYTCLANTYLCLGEHQSAVDCYIGSIKMSEQLGDKAVQAQGCFSVANAYSLMRDFPNAVEYHLKHLRFAEELEDMVGEAKACWCLGNAYTELQEHSKAYLFTCRHLELSIQMGDTESIAIARKNLSDLTTVMEIRDSSSRRSSERSGLFQMLFGRRKSSSPFSDVSQFDRLSLHRWSCGEGSSTKMPVKLQRSGSGTPLVSLAKEQLPNTQKRPPVLTSDPLRTVSKNCVPRTKVPRCKEPANEKLVEGEVSVDNCSPVREDSTKSARPCSPEVGGARKSCPTGYCRIRHFQE
jgi:G-protein signaling modulator 2